MLNDDKHEKIYHFQRLPRSKRLKRIRKRIDKLEKYRLENFKAEFRAIGFTHAIRKCVETSNYLLRNWKPELRPEHRPGMVEAIPLVESILDLGESMREQHEMYCLLFLKKKKYLPYNIEDRMNREEQ
tara:strand:+ start:2049 stop:2432 length:384 start_codon:yes stop_codon:yes gene_type:complete